MYYPLYLDLSDKNILIIGGGSIALRKLRSLYSKEGRIRLLAKEYKDELIDYCKDKDNIELIYQKYQKKYLSDIDLVIAATDDKDLNNRISIDSKDERIFCSNASEFKNGDFIMPSVFKRGDFIASFTTCGASPSLSKQAKQYMEDKYPKDFEKYVQILGEIRNIILKKDLSENQKKSILNELIDFKYDELVNMKKELEDETHTWNKRK